MPVDAEYQTEAARVIDRRMGELRALTFEEAAALPEASGEEAQLAGLRCAVTVFRQRDPFAMPNSILVTVQVASSGLLGIASYHIERGLVFTPQGAIREASALELQNPGG